MPYLPSEDLDAASSAAHVPAEIAGRYRVGEHLGTGAFGAVHRAFDRLTEGEVAIKLLPRALGPARLRRELVALRGLRLPGVVQLLDEGTQGEWFFLAMELVRGRPFPAGAPPLPWSTLQRSARSLLEVMGRVHAAGALHLDLKPANVHVLDDGSVCVLDLGLAGGSALGGAAPPGQSAGGTARYMAPEVLAAGTADARSDLYAIGLLLYQAASGAWPHSGPDASRLCHAARPLAAVAPHMPARVCAVIDTLLARDPDHRPDSAWAVLDRLGEDEPAWQPPLPDTERINQEALQPCFHGPERVLHLPSRAAERLFERTRGERARVIAELRAWRRAGVAFLDGERLRLYPPAFLHIERLLPGYDTLSHESRLVDDILSGQGRDTAAQARDIARAYLDEGRAERARIVLEQALVLLRRGQADAAQEPALLSLWALLALEDRTPRALDQALYQLGRASQHTEELRALETLLKIALHRMKGELARAEDELARLGPLDEPSLEIWRHALGIQLAVMRGPAREADAVRRALPWARRQGSSDVEARALSWVGRLRYDQGRFAEAATWQERSARRARVFLLRLSSQLNGASAWMEAGDYGNARRLARDALAEAQRRKQPIHEAHAEWLLRAIAYRAGDSLAADRELVEAFAHLQVPYLEGLIAVNEAAVCWRNGARAEARELACRARQRFEVSGQVAGRAVAHALELHCSPQQFSARARLADELRARPIPDITWQVLGLLSRSPGGEHLRQDAAYYARMARDPERRRELLAPCEVCT